MAHNYWGLAEIVRTIATNLVSSQAVASAVAFASCCKSLEEPVLGEVWRNLSSLAPLIKCFPPEIWFQVNLLRFTRAPLRTEWARFQLHYASKVRHLEVSCPEEEISLTTLHLLQNMSGSFPLLPNLASLSWKCDDERSISFVSLFISRSLTSIEIEVPTIDATMLTPIVAKLSTLPPHFRDIHIKVDDEHHDPSMVEASSQLLMQCNPNYLRKYNVDTGMYTSALRHAIQLPSLESFWLIFSSSACQLPDPLPAVVFPRLRALTVVHDDGDHVWLNLIPAIENPGFSSISVQCSGPDVVQFAETFRLTMTGCGKPERLEVLEVCGRVPFKITPHLIACTFSLKNLTTLHVLTKCSPVCQTSDLTDGDIDLLTNALPCLESLKLGGAPCRAPSNITFKGLSTISHRCPRLQILQIHFNLDSLITTVASTEAWDIALGLSCSPSSELCAVKAIHVGHMLWRAPRGQNETVVALGLVGIFPHLEKLEHNSRYDWGVVHDTIQTFRRMGRIAFGSVLLKGAHKE